MRPLALLATLLLVACSSGSEKAGRVAEVICGPAAEELGPAEMQDCLEENRAMFLDFQEQRLE